MLAALAALPVLPKLAAKPEPVYTCDPPRPPDPFCGVDDMLPKMPVGQISQYANLSSLPPGWLPCDGRVISPREHPALAQLLGTSYNPMPHSRLVKLPNINSHIRLTPHTNPQYEAYTGIRYMIKAR